MIRFVADDILRSRAIVVIRSPDISKLDWFNSVHANAISRVVNTQQNNTAELCDEGKIVTSDLSSIVPASQQAPDICETSSLVDHATIRQMNTSRASDDDHDYAIRLRMPDGRVKHVHTVSHG